MTQHTSLRLLGLAALVAVVGACSMERGENRVWRPGDPDPDRSVFFGPWNYTDAAGTDTGGPPGPPPPEVTNQAPMPRR
jgi:hypothetical protein